MALIGNTAGAIITKGLGFPACCFLITAPFGLACGCQIIPPPPPPSGGGGGPYPGVLMHTPVIMPPKVDTNTRMVIITVNVKDECKWRKQYVMSKRKANIVASAFNFVNVMKEKINLIVDNLRQVPKRVIVRFVDKYKNEDKE